MQVQSLGKKDPLKEKMAIHSSIFVWKILKTEELGRLQSKGLEIIRHDSAAQQSSMENI